MTTSKTWGVVSAEYADGRIDFAEFARRTERDRSGFVNRIHRQLDPIPSWHGAEDTSQDFLLEVWLGEKKYDPAKSRAGKYFRWHVKGAMKRVQKARGVEQHRRSGQPRFERPMAMTESETSLLIDGAPDAEWMTARTQYYSILMQLCTTQRQRVVIAALEMRGGDLDAASVAIVQAERSIRRRLGVRTCSDARRLVKRVVDELIEAYGQEETEAR